MQTKAEIQFPKYLSTSTKRKEKPMIDFSTALNSLCPGAKFYVEGNIGEQTIVWLDENVMQPTKIQIDEEIAKLQAQQKFDDCKVIAKEKIAATDWAVLPDVGLINQADFIAYRAALRALIINPVANPVWPTEPTPDWG